jgi:hypothetical protein
LRTKGEKTNTKLTKLHNTPSMQMTEMIMGRF